MFFFLMYGQTSGQSNDSTENNIRIFVLETLFHTRIEISLKPVTGSFRSKIRQLLVVEIRKSNSVFFAVYSFSFSFENLTRLASKTSLKSQEATIFSKISDNKQKLAVKGSAHATFGNCGI